MPFIPQYEWSENTFKSEIEAIPSRFPFSDNNSRTYNGARWAQHAWDLWELFKDMQECRWASNFGLQSLMRTLGYGLEDWLAIAPREIVINKGPIKENPAHDEPGTNLLLAAGVEMVDCEVSLGYTKPEDFKLNTRDHHFLAGLINYDNAHWASFVWDRYGGRLYLFDSAYGDRERRFKRTACAWRQALVQAGMPFDFDIFGIPLTPQPEEWECGYICTASLFYNLRGLVGNNYLQVVSIAGEKIVAFKGTRGSPIGPKPFDLVVRDWTQGLKYDNDNLEEQKEVTDSVRGFLGAIIMDELGMQMRHYLKGGVFAEPVGPDAIYRTLTKGQRAVPQDEAFTGKGGYQLYIPINGISADPLAFKHRIVRRDPTLARGGNIEFPAFKRRMPAATYWNDYLPQGLVDLYKARGVVLHDGGFRLETTGSNAPDVLDLTSPSPSDIAQAALKRLDQLKEKRPLTSSAPSGKVGSDGVKASQKKTKGSDGSMSSLSSLNTQATPEGLVADMKELTVDRKKTKAVSQRPTIRGSVETSMLPSDLDSYNPLLLQAAGKEMVFHSRNVLHPPMLSMRRTYYLPKSGTFSTYIPDGLIANTQWDEIIDYAMRGVVREETPAESRRDRYQRRHGRK